MVTFLLSGVCLESSLNSAISSPPVFTKKGPLLEPKRMYQGSYSTVIQCLSVVHEAIVATSALPLGSGLGVRHTLKLFNIV